MADISDADLAPAAPVKRTINWGGVLKGAAIVTAAVLVGWAVFAYVAPAITAYLASAAPGAAGAPMFGAEAARAAIQGISGAATWVFNGAAEIVTSIGSSLGITDLLKDVSSTISTNYHALSDTLSTKAVDVTSNIGAGAAAAVAGGTTALVGAKATAPHLMDIHTHDMAKIGHAASHDGVREASQKTQNWADRVGGSKSAVSSFREAADASRAAAATADKSV